MSGEQRFDAVVVGAGPAGIAAALMLRRSGRDVVVIDNSRVMHGRRRLADPGRRIFGAQSYRKGAIA